MSKEHTIDGTCEVSRDARHRVDFDSAGRVGCTICGNVLSNPSKMKLSEQKCENCRFWKLQGIVEGETYRGGVCRRYPPRDSSADLAQSIDTWWCGEWKGKIAGTICRHTGEVKETEEQR